MKLSENFFENWQFWKTQIFWVGHFELKKKVFFCLIPMKTHQSWLVFNKGCEWRVRAQERPVFWPIGSVAGLLKLNNFSDVTQRHSFSLVYFLLGFQGWVKILMINLISSQKSLTPNIFTGSVCKPNTLTSATFLTESIYMSFWNVL